MRFVRGFIVLVVLAGSVSLGACGEQQRMVNRDTGAANIDSGGGGSDSSTPGRDGGTPGTDSGVGGRDGGTPMTDGGSPADSFSGVDGIGIPDAVPGADGFSLDGIGIPDIGIGGGGDGGCGMALSPCDPATPCCMGLTCVPTLNRCAPF